MYRNLCEENVSVKTVMITEQMKPCLLCFKVILFFFSLRFTLKPVLTSHSTFPMVFLGLDVLWVYILQAVSV
jgi:hypothetical protein